MLQGALKIKTLQATQTPRVSQVAYPHMLLPAATLLPQCCEKKRHTYGNVEHTKGVWLGVCLGMKFNPDETTGA